MSFDFIQSFKEQHPFFYPHLRTFFFTAFRDRREREEERERNITRERSIDDCLWVMPEEGGMWHPDKRLNAQPRHVPSLGIKPATPQLGHDTSTN